MSVSGHGSASGLPRSARRPPLPALSRRDVLSRCSTGFGLLALSGLMAERGYAGLSDSSSTPLPEPHFQPRARHVIFCYMSGGVSHVDSFDPKPRLTEEHGQPMPLKVERTQFNNNGAIFASPFTFAQHGESGIPISSLFPHVARCADDLAVIRSMTTAVNEHAQGNYAMHTGFPFLGHPSAGAWVNYGLGSENQELPGFVVLESGGAVPPHGGIGLYSSGYLPAQHQASIIEVDQPEPVRNIRPPASDLTQRSRLSLIRTFDEQFLASTGGDAQVDAAVRNYETAFRMQSAVPELCDISGETQATRELYGIDSDNPQLAAYARQCLSARRLIERGVRFVELSCLTVGIGAGNGPNPWDQHGDLEKGHAAMARQVDQPIGALLTDLKSRGQLDQTLVIWAGEFGRTPFSQGSNGRDHNPFGFSIWLAGGGIKGGTIYGATDEYGYHAIENPCTIYDLWATVLFLLGLDHERLTYRYSGRDFRLTDVHGQVLHDVIA